MTKQRISCVILGGQEADLQVLGELHRQAHVRISCVYDPGEDSVAMEIAEIMGISRCHTVGELANRDDVDYIIVSEPRARFTKELRLLTRSGAKVISPGEAIRMFRKTIKKTKTPKTPPDYTIEQTLIALERLLDRDELLKFLLDVAVKATSATAGSIMLYSDDSRELYFGYATGLSERVIKNTRQKLGHGIAGRVALKRQAVLVHLSSDDTLYARDRERMNIVGAISVPLLWENRLLGVLNVSVDKGGPKLGDAELEKLKTLSKRISRVVDESIKIHEVQVKHRESKFRSTMSTIAERPLATRQKFSVLSAYLSELVGAETVEVYMSTTEGDWFVLSGSNRWLGPQEERVRCHRGALSRAFLEKRTITMTESVEPQEGSGSMSSVVYCPLETGEPRGVVVLEFTDRSKLNDFLIVESDIVVELSRFVASELRERRLRREVKAMATLSDSVASLLSTHTVEDLCGVLARIVGDVLESPRVSVRLRERGVQGETRVRYRIPADEASEEWQEEDAVRYERLQTKKKPFSMAFLNFEAEVRRGGADHHSLLAYPIQSDDSFLGGIIAYDKNSGDPLEDAVYSDLDRTILQSVCSLIQPVLGSIYQRRSPEDVEPEPRTYSSLLRGNLKRFETICANEIVRSDRYHQTFTILLFRIKPLGDLLDADFKKGLALVDEITRGVEARTRKTDFGSWIHPGTYAVLSLEGGRRIRFLVSRIMLYLAKDLASVKNLEVKEGDILVGQTTYPGTAKAADELIEQAEKSLGVYTSE